MVGYDRISYRAALGNWGHWFAGFIDGEGAFMLFAQTSHGNTRPTILPRFMVNQRADDKAVLEEIQNKLGFGKLYHHTKNAQRPGEKPAWRFEVHRKEDCIKIAKIFKKYPLHSRKKRQFEIWCEAVEICKWAKGSHSKKRYEQLASLVPKLHALREWNPPLDSSTEN